MGNEIHFLSVLERLGPPATLDISFFRSGLYTGSWPAHCLRDMHIDNSHLEKAVSKMRAAHNVIEKHLYITAVRKPIIQTFRNHDFL